MKTLITLLTALAVLLLASPAGAQPPTDLGEYPTTPGATCTLTTANNVSEHPGNTLVIVNGEQTITIPRVEDNAGDSFSHLFTAQTDSVKVDVQLNESEEFPWTSLSVTVTCAEIPTTTTTTPPPTTPPHSDPPPTTPPTTTPPPPVTTCVEAGTCHPDTGGAETGGLAVTLLLAGAAVTLTAGALHTHRTK